MHLEVSVSGHVDEHTIRKRPLTDSCPSAVKDYTVPSMGKVLAWAKLDKVGTKIEVTKPSFQQVPQPGTIQPEPVYLYTEQ